MRYEIPSDKTAVYFTWKNIFNQKIPLLYSFNFSFPVLINFQKLFLLPKIHFFSFSMISKSFLAICSLCSTTFFFIRNNYALSGSPIGWNSFYSRFLSSHFIVSRVCINHKSLSQISHFPYVLPCYITMEVIMLYSCEHLLYYFWHSRTV